MIFGLQKVHRSEDVNKNFEFLCECDSSALTAITHNDAWQCDDDQRGNVAQHHNMANDIAGSK